MLILDDPTQMNQRQLSYRKNFLEMISLLILLVFMFKLTSLLVSIKELFALQFYHPIDLTSFVMIPFLWFCFLALLSSSSSTVPFLMNQLNPPPIWFFIFIFIFIFILFLFLFLFFLVCYF